MKKRAVSDEQIIQAVYKYRGHLTKAGEALGYTDSAGILTRGLRSPLIRIAILNSRREVLEEKLQREMLLLMLEDDSFADLSDERLKEHIRNLHQFILKFQDRKQSPYVNAIAYAREELKMLENCDHEDSSDMEEAI